MVLTVSTRINKRRKASKGLCILSRLFGVLKRYLREVNELNEWAERAVRQCDFINADRTCSLMMALKTETDPRCRYWRDDPQECRYLTMHVYKRGRR